MKVKRMFVLTSVLTGLLISIGFEGGRSLRRIKDFRCSLVEGYVSVEPAFRSDYTYFPVDASVFIEKWREHGISREDLKWLKGIVNILGADEGLVLNVLSGEGSLDGLLFELSIRLVNFIVDKVAGGDEVILSKVDSVAFPMVDYLRLIYPRVGRGKKIAIIKILGRRKSEPSEVVGFFMDLILSKGLTEEERRKAFDALCNFGDILALKRLLADTESLLEAGIVERGELEDVINRKAEELLPKFKNFWELKDLVEERGRVYLRLLSGEFIQIEGVYPLLIPFGSAYIVCDKENPYGQNSGYAKFREFREQLSALVIWNDVIEGVEGIKIYPLRFGD